MLKKRPSKVKYRLTPSAELGRSYIHRESVKKSPRIDDPREPRPFCDCDYCAGSEPEMAEEDE